MAHAIRMPSSSELPNGPRRDFVDELFEHYRAARRPTLREISDQIEAVDAERQLAGTASRETIRRMLRGKVVPARWATVEAVLYGLCDLANRDPEADRWPDDDDSPTFIAELERRWHDAVDAGDIPPQPADPWSSDEPPF